MGGRLSTIAVLRLIHSLVHAQHDANSTGPPPPCAILVRGLGPLVLASDIRAHFRKFGDLQEFDQQVDKATGAYLGVVWIRYAATAAILSSILFTIQTRFESHAIASLALQKSNGKPLTGVGHTSSRTDVMVVEFDGEKVKLDKFLKEKEEERKERERKRRDAEKVKSVRDAGITPRINVQRMPNGNTTPSTFAFSRAPPGGAGSRATPTHLHNSASSANAHAGPSTPSQTPSSSIPAGPGPISPARIRRPPAALVKARLSTALSFGPTLNSQHGSTRAISNETTSGSGKLPPWANRQHFATFPMHPTSHPSFPHSQHLQQQTPFAPLASNTKDKPVAQWASSGRLPRTPSPQRSHETLGMAVHSSPGLGVHVSPGKGKVKDEGVLAELSRNRFDHIKVDAAGLGVTEMEIRGMFSGFNVDKVRGFVLDHISFCLKLTAHPYLTGAGGSAVLVRHIQRTRHGAAITSRRWCSSITRPVLKYDCASTSSPSRACEARSRG